MSKRINKSELVNRIAKRLSKNTAEIDPVTDAVLEEIYEALKQEETISLRNFGTFYIDVRHSRTVFKFNPSQRLKALFGWSSTYKGEL
ncbi:MAG: HU family DNA-binding protein [Chloroflexota bacterium]